MIIGIDHGFQTEKGLEEYTVVSVLKTDIRKFPFTKVDFPDEVSLKEYVERQSRRNCLKPEKMWRIATLC